MFVVGLKGKHELGVVLWKREMRMSRDAAAYGRLALEEGTGAWIESSMIPTRNMK